MTHVLTIGASQAPRQTTKPCRRPISDATSHQTAIKTHDSPCVNCCKFSFCSQTSIPNQRDRESPTKRSVSLGDGASPQCGVGSKIHDATYTSVGFTSHHSAKIHITPVWMLFPGITHQRREYTSEDANPQVDAMFCLQVVQAQTSGYATDARVSRTFHCILEYFRAHFGTESPSRRCVFPSHESMP